MCNDIAQWHQWLRHTRQDPPSIAEQQLDVQRQSQLKYLAKLADERWAAKPSFLDSPGETSQPGPGTLPRDQGGYAGQTEPGEKEGIGGLVGDAGGNSRGREENSTPRKEKENPWKSRRGNTGKGWQPQAWTPGSSKR